MKKQFHRQKMFLLALVATTALSSSAQQHFTQTCSTANRECNSACTVINTLPLGSNAILLATPKNAGSRLIGVWYKKVNGNWTWNVNYQDAKTMSYGDQFDVQYFATPDSNYQFVHRVYPNTTTVQKVDTSYINHVNLNGKPNAIFHYIANGNGTNMYAVTFQYSAARGKWYLFNDNHKPLDYGAAYNIVIESIPVLGKPRITVDTIHRKNITKPAGL
jgi:hypothetical protein